MSDVTVGRTETDEAVYSNCDCVINDEVAAQLTADPDLFACHAAWNFCGYVRFDGELWHDEVWRYHSVVATISGPDLADVIHEVNGRYGYD